jgi:hypothetical protein
MRATKQGLESAEAERQRRLLELQKRQDALVAQLRAELVRAQRCRVRETRTFLPRTCRRQRSTRMRRSASTCSAWTSTAASGASVRERCVIPHASLCHVWDLELRRACLQQFKTSQVREHLSFVEAKTTHIKRAKVSGRRTRVERAFCPDWRAAQMASCGCVHADSDTSAGPRTAEE